MSAVVDEGARPGSQWSRRYPPLISIFVALLIAVLVLPSALNIPQSNPTQTAEYAPVPPGANSAPVQGNTSNLGLGNNATIGDNGSPPPPPKGLTLPPSLTNTPLPGKTPTTKQCVRDAKGVLRQTDDPLAPPCVPDFQGDNFGATYQGVTAQEVRILVYLQGDTSYTDLCAQANVPTGAGVYYDMAQPATGSEPCDITGLRIWQQYFNTRYQTYKRFVHFFAYFSPQADSPEARRADAADNYARIKPFAVVSFGANFESDYLQAMAQYKVLNFGSFNGRDNAFFNQFPKLIWGYAPSVEQQAANYASFVCQKMAGKPTSFSDATYNGKPRKYGLMYTTDPGHAELREFKDRVVAAVRQCGITFAATATFPITDIAQDDAQQTQTYFATNLAQFKSANITTIIWAGGIETNQSTAAANINYFPEWLVAGNGAYADGYGTNSFQNGREWDHAWVVTFEPYEPATRERLCYQAYKSVDPSQATDTDIRTSCIVYDNLRQLMTGIQVAGPRLGPTSIDQGYHAIPAQESFNSQVPACYYEAGDYTCIKDGVAEWWDSTGQPPAGTRPTGCWRAANFGQRYLTGGWPSGDVIGMKQRNDPCSGFGAIYIMRG
ncbi:MAG: hypothetical protein ACYDD7_09985 [Acidimicrobiales bacterium]